MGKHDRMKKGNQFQWEFPRLAVGVKTCWCSTLFVFSFGIGWWCQLTSIFHSAIQTIQSTKQFSIEWPSGFMGSAIFVWPVFQILDVATIQELLFVLSITIPPILGVEIPGIQRFVQFGQPDTKYPRPGGLLIPSIPSISRVPTVLVLPYHTLRLCWSTSSRNSTLAVLEKGRSCFNTAGPSSNSMWQGKILHF